MIRAGYALNIPIDGLNSTQIASSPQLGAFSSPVQINGRRATKRQPGQGLMAGIMAANDSGPRTGNLPRSPAYIGIMDLIITRGAEMSPT